MQGSEIFSQVVFHRSSSAEDDLKQKFQPKIFFFIFSKKKYSFSIFDIFFNFLILHSSFEEVIGTYKNVKIATLDFIFSY